jgi:hypothetical protein
MRSTSVCVSASIAAFFAACLLLQAEIELNHKWDLIIESVADDNVLNRRMYSVVDDNRELYLGLESQHVQACSLLLNQLAPAGAAASCCADAGRDELAREAAVVARLPVCGAVPPQRLAAAAACGAGEVLLRPLLP